MPGEYAALAASNLSLHGHQRAPYALQAGPRKRRKSLVRRIRDDRQQSLHTPQTNRRHDAELG